MPFIKIATQIIATERIAEINRNANINGQVGVELTLHNTPQSFRYTGDFASIAYDALEGIQANPLLQLGQDDPICLADIEWVDLEATFASQSGVEIRVSTDGDDVTRKYTGDDASQAYDVLVAAMGF